MLTATTAHLAPQGPGGTFNLRDLVDGEIFGYGCPMQGIHYFCDAPVKLLSSFPI